jgi:hypothetical protein
MMWAIGSQLTPQVYSLILHRQAAFLSSVSEANKEKRQTSKNDY